MLSWLRRLRQGTQGRLEAIFITDAAGEPMRSVDSITAIADQGLEGDRYGEAKGFWKSTDACEVTLISEHDLKRASGRGAHNLEQGAHRRNLVISGLSSRQLEGRDFRIGEAVFRYQKPRPPCGYLDRVEGAGMARALGRHSGVCITVLQGGRITTGDRLELLPKMRP
jgi:MOSC domain-containing protein YiiM